MRRKYYFRHRERNKIEEYIVTCVLPFPKQITQCVAHFTEPSVRIASTKDGWQPRCAVQVNKSCSVLTDTIRPLTSPSLEYDDKVLQIVVKYSQHHKS